jgi:hypothetical protein
MFRSLRRAWPAFFISGGVVIGQGSPYSRANAGAEKSRRTEMTRMRARGHDQLRSPLGNRQLSAEQRKAAGKGAAQPGHPSRPGYDAVEDASREETVAHEDSKGQAMNAALNSSISANAR